MAEPIRVVSTAPDADSGAGEAANEASTADARQAIPAENVISDAVANITRLMSDMTFLREGLIANGIPAQTVTVLIEMNLHRRTEARDRLVDSAIQGARESFGDTAIEKRRLLGDLDQLVALEQDLAHVRRILREQGVNVQAMNFLTQLIRQNPGDGGAAAVRDFVAYSIACGLPIGDALERAESLTIRSASVLPKIERRVRPSSLASTIPLLREIVVGTLVGFSLLLMMV